jgi:cysteine-S-conjugate beta-lyase
VILPSGQVAIAITFLTVLMSGDHVLVPDTAYPPVTGFCRDYREPRGITWSVYAPCIGRGIEAQIRPETKLIWMKSPGSTTMEVEDVPAIVKVAKARGILTGIDNTWATPLLRKPLAHGIDFSMQALTKYPGGHSDVLMGSVSVRDLDLRRRLRDTMRMLGLGVAPDAVAMVLRGMQTMAMRVAHVGRVATEIATELHDRSVGEVLFPALPSCPGHEFWERDFAGASGLLSVVLPAAVNARLDLALNGLQVFAIGASWGGTRSLVALMSVAGTRQVAHPRISIGLEDPADLRDDLAALFGTLAKTRKTAVG